MSERLTPITSKASCDAKKVPMMIMMVEMIIMMVMIIILMKLMKKITKKNTNIMTFE